MGAAFRTCFRHSFRDRNTPFLGRRRALPWGCRRTARERQRYPRRLTGATSARCVANHTMYPLIRPGSIVQIDGNQRKVLPVHGENEHERPIFFTELRDEYICSWCEIREGHLLAVPYPNSRCEIRRFPHPREADIVGLVTGVAMRLAESHA